MPNLFRRILYPSSLVMLSFLLGVIGMIQEQIPVTIWLQNPLFILLMTCISLLIIRTGIHLSAGVLVTCATVFLGITLAGKGIDGVHRWLTLGPLSLNVSSAVLPASIVAYGRLTDKKAIKTSFIVVLIGIGITTLLIFLQPDASQLLAFSSAMLILLISSRYPKTIIAGTSILLLLLTVLSWFRPDTLAPVSFTEGILAVLLKHSKALCFFGLLALFSIPAYFFWDGIKTRQRICIAVAIYYSMILLAPFFGSFPIPFMGYGLSPVLGFFMMLVMLNQHDPGKL